MKQLKRLRTIVWNWTIMWLPIWALFLYMVYEEDSTPKELIDLLVGRERLGKKKESTYE